jgi:hypothetical protein
MPVEAKMPVELDPKKVGPMEELYRDKLVDWMISLDIPTGGSAQTFDDLLQVIGTYVTTLKKERDPSSIYRE